MTTDTAVIRRASKEDEGPLLGLWETFLREQSKLDDRFQVAEDATERWRNDFPALIKHERRRILVAEQAGELVGFITAQRWAPPPVYRLSSEVYVEELYVRPEARGADVGSKLLEAVTSWANEIGADRLRLVALAENADGRTFWEGRGARPYSVTYTFELGNGRREEEEKPKGKLGF